MQVAAAPSFDDFSSWSSLRRGLLRKFHSNLRNKANVDRIEHRQAFLDVH